MLFMILVAKIIKSLAINLNIMQTYTNKDEII